MNKNLSLEKIIIISLFIALTYLANELSKIYLLNFFKMPFGGYFFKFSLFLLLLSGFLLNWKHSLIVCLFFSFYHIFRSFPEFLTANKEIWKLNLSQNIWVIFLDYLLPDLSFSATGFFYHNALTKLKNKKTIACSIFITLFLRTFFYFCSSYFIFIDIIFKNSYKKDSFWIFLYKILEYSPFLFCFIYNLIPFIISYIFSLMLIIFFKPYIEKHLLIYFNLKL